MFFFPGGGGGRRGDGAFPLGEASQASHPLSFEVNCTAFLNLYFLILFGMGGGNGVDNLEGMLGPY
jgi:hypothetical protein